MPKFCSNCGAEIDEKAEICPKCGVRAKQVLAQKEMKSSGIAVILSFFIPGLGQIYNGEIGKGVLFIIVGFLLALSMIVLIGFILYPIFWIYNMYDAYKTAERINLE
jgi:TM2 domain-containing membrane protein YozV